MIVPSTARQLVGRGGWHHGSSGHGHRVRNHGREAGRWQCRHGPSWQHHSDRGDSLCADHDFRSGVGGAFQSGGDAGLCHLRREITPTSAPLMFIGVQFRWWSVRGDAGASDVRGATAADVAECRVMAVRSGLSEFVATFGLLTVIFGGLRWRPDCRPGAGRTLYHRRLLVHRLDQLCQSGGHHRARPSPTASPASCRRTRRGSSSRSWWRPASRRPGCLAGCLPEDTEARSDQVIV